MKVAEILAGIARLRVLIVGDICLDRWCNYDPRHFEPSRETGLRRIGVASTVVTPGGGGTVANNVVALGARHVAVLGVAGEDGNGYELDRALSAGGIDAGGLIRVAGLQTFTYTKLINRATGVEDQPRVDFIHEEPLSPVVEQELVLRLRAMAPNFDLIVALDQSETEGAGCLTAAVRSVLSEIAREHPEIVIWADSRIRCELFSDVTVKINRQEADAACARIAGDYFALRSLTRAPRLFVTDGPIGVHVVEAALQTLVPAQNVERPVDICGAGDSFSAGAGCALAIGAPATQAADFGNMVASITIMKPGTGTATPAELLMLKPII